jgi:hypothetical protein
VTDVQPDWKPETEGGIGRPESTRPLEGADA